jgi:hypothetical protein
MYQYDYQRHGWAWNGELVKGCHSQSFRPQNSTFAIDQHGLFCAYNRVRGQDAASVQVLNNLFAKDAKNVYCITGTAKKIVDPASFEAVHPPGFDPASGELRIGYGRDKFHVYYHDGISGVPKVMKNADPATFEVLHEEFGKDRECVWCRDTKMKGADPATFVVLNGLWSKDAKRVYYSATGLAGSDPATFRIIEGYTGADKASVWRMREKVEGADPATYVVPERRLMP